MERRTIARSPPGLHKPHSDEGTGAIRIAPDASHPSQNRHVPNRPSQAHLTRRQSRLTDYAHESVPVTRFKRPREPADPRETQEDRSAGPQTRMSASAAQRFAADATGAGAGKPECPNLRRCRNAPESRWSFALEPNRVAVPFWPRRRSRSR